MNSAVIVGTAGAILLLSSAMPALAYIDPVTGSIVIQSIVGGLAAFAVSMRSVRKKVIGIFKSKQKDDTGNA